MEIYHIVGHLNLHIKSVLELLILSLNTFKPMFYTAEIRSELFRIIEMVCIRKSYFLFENLF